MTVTRKQLGILLLLVSCAAGQTADHAASIREIRITRSGKDVRVEISLSGPVKASVSTAIHPDRLVVDLPNTLADSRQKHIPVDFSGVRAVRIGLNSSNPPVTRVIVDLDDAQPYALDQNGSHVVLTVSPPAVARSNSQQGAPAAAASGGFIGVFRRQKRPPPPETTADAQPLPAPPPSQPPLNFPESQAATAQTAHNAGSQPTAAHPNRGSLQEGTVFPSLGTPGAGAVPAVGSNTPSGFDSNQSANATAKNTTAANEGTTFPSGNHGAGTSVSAATSTPALPPAAPATSVNQAATSAPSNSPSQSLSQGSSRKVSAVESGSAAAAVPQSNPTPTPPSSGGQPEAAEVTAPEAQPDSNAAAEGSEPQVTNVAASDTDQQMMALRASDPNLRTVFKVKYVAEGVAYLDGGRSSGLSEGMKLEILHTDVPPRQGMVADPSDPRVTAELEVTGVADTSSVTDIHSAKTPVKAGDLAYLSNADAQTLIQQRALSATRKYPAVVTFTEGDPLEEEARAEVPKPPLPSVNRARGRIGLDYIGTSSSGFTTSDLGVVIRADVTRLNGTYWNLSGYWRGRIQSISGSGASQATLQDLINRTYHLSMTYDNPNSPWVAGFGRLYLPWAPSLETIDGGYFGRRIAKGVTTGIFAGTTPDPTSYSYNPNQEIGGAFINFDGGSYDAWKYTSTSGFGVSAINLAINRPFVFFENGIFYKRFFSIYDSLQADSPKGNTVAAAPGPGLSRNFLTIRIQPLPRLELDVNHNYFRDIPTFDPALATTGLLDKYLFQGFSAGARVEVAKQIWVYGSLGGGTRTGDKKMSLNESVGVTFGRLPKLGVRTDFHYSRFNSDFGYGSYESVSLSRNLSEAFRLEVLLGQQNFAGALSNNGQSRFFNANLESTLGAHYFILGGLGFNRGELSYNQWHFTLGYRFDSKEKEKK